MSKIDPQRAAVFVVVLAIIAIFINSARDRSVRQQTPAFFPQVSQQAQLRQESERRSELEAQQHLQQQQLELEAQQQAQHKELEREQAAAAQKAADDAAAQHAAYLARYLNDGAARTPGVQNIAIVVASENGKLDHTMSTELARYFTTDSVKISTSFFKPEFISDNLFANVFDGSTEIISKLELANSLDALVFARLTVQYVNNSSLGIISANMQLEVQVVPIAGSIQSQTWKFLAHGAGFSQVEARANAEERIIKKLGEIKMSL